MQSIKTVRNQTLLDLSIQIYGTEDALWQMYLWNRNLYTESNTSLDMALTEGVEVFYSPSWEGENRIIKKEINHKIIATYATI